MNRRPLRVLHVVGGMNRGGIETWLMQVLRHADRSKMKMDFLVHSDQECAYDAEIRSLGARLIPCPSPHRPHEYARNFRAILSSEGPFDVVHSHVHHFNGYVLRLAEQCGIHHRIAHSHNDTRAVDGHSGIGRRTYFALSKYLIRRHSTCGLGCSTQAAASLFGSKWRQDPRFRTLMYSIDLAPYRKAVSRSQVRKSLGVAPDALVIGHVGRFVGQKNHRFLLEIFGHIARCDARAVLVLVGEGPLRFEMEAEVRKARLSGRVLFAGLRDDIADVMRAGFDLFLLPSLHEGLGLVLVEAQAAALPALFSDVTPQEASVIPQLAHRFSLTRDARDWSEAALKLLEMGRTISPEDALRALEASPFNIRRGLTSLEGAYHG